jgi:hypothetical protein
MRVASNFSLEKSMPIKIFFIPFLYKTEINSLARVTKIKDMVKNGAYNYITNHNRPVYTSDTFLYEFYSDWVPSPAMPLVNL